MMRGANWKAAFRNFLALAALLLLAAVPVVAQVDRATLAGTVTDATGAVIPGAKVEVVSQETGLRRDGLSGANGAYGFAQLPIGSYTVTASLTGFKTVAMRDVRLGVGDNRVLNLQLEIGSLETSVTVESVAAPIDKSSAVIGTVIESQQIREIPLNGRHWASLMALAPGAINTGEGNQQSIRFVGRARDDNNWTLDGLDATGVKDPRQEVALRLIISTDSIAEFRVNSTLYSAESGSGAGGQVNIVTKSGSNAFHGSAFEFLRNDVLDARNPFDTSKQPFRLNQFGGSFGGPIAKNRTFFFANYEGMRQLVYQTFRNDVPSAAFRARAANADIRRIVNAYPVGTETTSNADIDRVVGNVGLSLREDSFTARVDHSFNDRNSAFVRYNFDDGINIAPRTVIAGDHQDALFRPTNLVMQYQRVFSPSVVNETKLGMNRSALHRYSFAPFTESFAVSGFTTLNNSNLAIEVGTSYSLIDSLAITRGRHNLRVGGEIRRAHVNVADPVFDSITITYASRPDLLANRIDRIDAGTGNAVLGTRKWYYYAYAQDDIKVKSNLTLNLGLRYEYYSINREVADRYKVFDMFECRGFCPHGSPWYFPDRNNFDPRVGFAWSPTSLKGRTVIRGGGGIYHGPGQIDDVNTALDNNSVGYSLTLLEAPGLSYPVTPFLTLAKSVGVTPRSLQRDRRDLYNASWGLSVQQELPRRFVMQVGYNGSSGVKLFARSDINVLDPVTRTRPLATFGRIDEKRQDGKSNFNALQVSLYRRVGRGLNWGTEYMWSHAIHDGNIGGGEGAQAQNVSCRACDRGNSPQDIRHTFTSNWIYQLPFGPGHRFLASGPASRVLGGWETSGIWVMRTGRPLTVTIARSSGDLPDGNSRSPRPNLVPGVSIYPAGGPTFDQWFNPAAFAIPASRTWGNAGRAIATGPGLAQVDFSLQKRNKLTESTALVIRADMFNLFNRTQAGNPGSTFTSPASFGLVTGGLNRILGTGTSRQIQMALRLVF
jgi:outer membrane receptor protein involved in Fe transport